MIYIAFGSNLPVGGRSPAAVVRAAVAALQRHGVALPAVSSLWRTAPVPAADQPDYVNAVARAETALSPADLLALLHRVEAEFGRVRGLPNAARGLDLDLIDFDGLVSVPGAVPMYFPGYQPGLAVPVAMDPSMAMMMQQQQQHQPPPQ